jgi:hypothetical protein
LPQVLSHQASLPGGRALALSSKRNNFIHSAVPRARSYWPNHTAKTVAQFTIGLIFRPYTELGFILPSKRPASVAIPEFASFAGLRFEISDRHARVTVEKSVHNVG